MSKDTLPLDDYNLTVRRQVQRRHIEGTQEYERYAAQLSSLGLKPSVLDARIDVQALILEFHGKGRYAPNPKDHSPREAVNTGRIIGRYWDKVAQAYVPATWVKMVYSRYGTHVFPIRPEEGDDL